MVVVALPVVAVLALAFVLGYYLFELREFRPFVDFRVGYVSFKVHKYAPV
jgi:hypothetical protein